MSRAHDVQRIRDALELASGILARHTPGEIEWTRKAGGDPVTAADLEVSAALQRALPRGGEGWLCEETVDEGTRLGCSRVWVVDPLDGTRQFVSGIPEWSVSIALVQDGEAVAGGVANPAAGIEIVGSRETGVSLNGRPTELRRPGTLAGAEVLASRSEFARGEWARFESAPFRVRRVGSVAYKLALVAAGLADATWTLRPKHEWDVAAGVALVRAAGARAWTPDGRSPRFNRMPPLLTGLAAAPPELAASIGRLLGQPLADRPAAAGGGVDG